MDILENCLNLEEEETLRILVDHKQYLYVKRNILQKVLVGKGVSC